MSRKTTINEIRLSTEKHKILLAHGKKDYDGLRREFQDEDVVLIIYSDNPYFLVHTFNNYNKGSWVAMADKKAFEILTPDRDQEEYLSDALDNFILDSLERLLYSRNNGMEVRDEEIDELFSFLRGKYIEKGKKAIIRSRVIQDMKVGIPIVDGLANYVQQMIEFAENKFKEKNND